MDRPLCSSYQLRCALPTLLFGVSIRGIQLHAMALCGCVAASQITTVGSSLSLCSTLSEDNLRRWVAASVRTRSQRAASTRDDGVSISSRLQGRNAADELVTQSRRSVVQTGATLALLAVFDRLPAVAEPAQSEPEASGSQEAASGAGTATVQPASKPKKSLVDIESWYRVRGEGFAMSVPPNYEDIVEYDESGSSLYGERAKEKPFAARFASPDRKEVLSVVIRNGSQLKLSFLQTQDITEFGSLEEAAKVFVPAGSKIVAAATHKPTDSRVPRTYYLYEFLAKDDKRVVMSAAAAGGRVFVFGAMAPNSRWKEVGSTMRSAAINFALR